MKRIALLLVVTTLICAQASATYVKDIQLGLNMSTWYSGSTGIFQYNSFGNTNVPAATALIRTHGAAFYDYKITNAVFTMTPCTLVSDNAPGGAVNANGTFTGGAAMTITGTIQEVDELGNDVGSPVFTGTLLTADMASVNWGLVEIESFPGQTNTVSGDQVFTVTGGELADGTTSGLEILDFNVKFTMSLSGTITDFGSTVTYTDYVPILQFNAPIPEPATMLLLLGGGVFTLRRKR